MHRHSILGALLVLACVLPLAACGGNDDEREAATPPPETGPAARAGRPAAEQPSPERQTEKAFEAAAELARKEREEEERIAAEDGVEMPARVPGLESALAELPIGAPPLPVRQYIVEGRRLIAGIDPADLVCGRSAPARLELVEPFADQVRALLARHGAPRFTLVVAEQRDDPTDVVALAQGDDGAVALTERGRGVGSC